VVRVPVCLHGISPFCLFVFLTFLIFFAVPTEWRIRQKLPTFISRVQSTESTVEQRYAHYLETCTISSTILVDSVLSWHSRALYQAWSVDRCLLVEGSTSTGYVRYSHHTRYQPRTVVATDFDISLITLHSCRCSGLGNV
jgi:hypothetical protein